MVNNFAVSALALRAMPTSAAAPSIFINDRRPVMQISRLNALQNSGRADERQPSGYIACVFAEIGRSGDGNAAFRGFPGCESCGRFDAVPGAGVDAPGVWEGASRSDAGIQYQHSRVHDGRA